MIWIAAASCAVTLCLAAAFTGCNLLLDNGDARYVGGSGGTIAGDGAGGPGPNGDAGAACDLHKDFGDPEPLLFLQGGPIDGTYPTFWPDENTMHYSLSTVDAGVDYSYRIFVAERVPGTNVFHSVRQAEYIDSSQYNVYSRLSNPTFSSNGLAVFVACEGNTLDGTRICLATRASAEATFSSFQPVDLGADTGDDMPYLRNDTELWFRANRNSEGNQIYESTENAGKWPGASRIALAGAIKADDAPVPSSDGLTLYFRRFYRSPSDAGSYRIWTTHRDSLALPFGTPVVAETISPPSSYFDRPGWLSPDGCRFYLSSTRADPKADGGLGIYHLYVAMRPR